MLTVTTTGARFSYRHDQSGRLVGATDAAGHSTQQTFDASGRLLEAVTRSGTRLTIT